MKATIATAFLSAAVGAQTGPNSDRPESYVPGASLGLSVRPNLEDGESWVEVLPTHDRDIAVFAAAPIDVPGKRLVEWARHVELLYKSRYVPVIARFSSPPRVEDLQALLVDDKDLEDIRKCEPGDCGVKLSDNEIDYLRQTIAREGVNWKDAVQKAFRHLVLARVERYLAEGNLGAAPYHDKKEPVWLESEFAAIVDRSELAIRDFPRLASYLTLYPRVRDPSIESFLYWSTEKLGARPIISVTHVHIVGPAEPDLEALIIAKQVYASHYMTSALSMTAITRGAGGSQRYLVYLNRSRTDVFDGMFGGWVRRIVERRLRSEAPAAIDALRLRLEGGRPEQANFP